MYDKWVTWFQLKYGDEIGLFLAKRASSLINKINDPCIDNYRVAEIGNILEEEEYKNLQKNGCCGFSDTLITHYASGRKFMLGFNYGH